MVSRLPPRARAVAGALLLAASAWAAFRGRIACFDPYDAHRFTARAMLAGSLAMRAMVSHAGHDEQVFDGAVYTNWGFGVPLLQAPFHALAGALHFGHGFFPDRTIFFLYLCAAMPVVWLGVGRTLARVVPDAPATTRQLVAWTATWALLQVAVFPLMEGRFVVFEETAAYMALAELVALGVYLAARDSWSPRLVVLMGVASGVGLLVRSVGLLYVVVWAALFGLEARPRWRRLGAYAAVIAPFVVFWLWSNAVRSGSPLGLGYINSSPAWDAEMPILRFGSRCIDSPGHFLAASWSLFCALFVLIWPRMGGAWMSDCHFDFEQRDGTGEPFFGPVVLLVAALVVFRRLRARERRVAPWVPVAAMAFLFFAFVRRGEGFAWRYVGDFWPLVALMAADHLESLPRSSVRVSARTAQVLFAIGALAMARYVLVSTPRPSAYGQTGFLPVEASAAIEQERRASQQGMDPPWPSRLDCPHVPGTAYDDGMGWTASCRVSAITNVYLGVPSSPSDHHVLRFAADGADAATLAVYVDGAIVTAHHTASGYEADVNIDRRALASPVVVVTVLWTPDRTPSPVRLAWIELA